MPQIMTHSRALQSETLCARSANSFFVCVLFNVFAYIRRRGQRRRRNFVDDVCIWNGVRVFIAQEITQHWSRLVELYMLRVWIEFDTFVNNLLVAKDLHLACSERPPIDTLDANDLLAAHIIVGVFFYRVRYCAICSAFFVITVSWNVIAIHIRCHLWCYNI